MTKNVIGVNGKNFIIDPDKLPFMTGFQGSLGDIFLKPADGIKIVKQILIVSGYYSSWYKLRFSEGEYWATVNKKVTFYDREDIIGSDYVYYLAGQEVGRGAFLQDSEYYTGARGGIYANENITDFVPIDSPLARYMEFLDSHPDYCYLADMDSVRRDMGFNYILTTKYGNKSIH